MGLFQKGVLYFAATVFGVFSTVALIGFSFYEVGNRETTDVGSISCSSGPFAEYRPLRFSLDGGVQFYFCSWDSRNHALRFVTAFLSLGWLALLVIGVRRRSKRLLYVFFAGSLVVAVLLLAAAGADGRATTISQTWCNKGMSGSGQSSGSISCDFMPQWEVVVLDIVAAVCWVVLSGVTFWYARKHVSGYDSGLDRDYLRFSSHSEQGEQLLGRY
eukprot:TRINITY_DN4819_c0_g1_i1.p1 TRINITY_DN4819_c0_g1~~TRINITY_DN4819_c0_g1_i1.p1  ORF type:complete len:216 (-),score=62.46 TRINITY_DN4819_c0_g1_i1:755-1402(-)